jgi:hypothetical protein
MLLTTLGSSETRTTTLATRLTNRPSPIMIKPKISSRPRFGSFPSIRVHSNSLNRPHLVIHNPTTYQLLHPTLSLPHRNVHSLRSSRASLSRNRTHTLLASTLPLPHRPPTEPPLQDGLLITPPIQHRRPLRATLHLIQPRFSQLSSNRRLAGHPSSLPLPTPPHSNSTHRLPPTQPCRPSPTPPPSLLNLATRPPTSHLQAHPASVHGSPPPKRKKHSVRATSGTTQLVQRRTGA